MFALTVSNSYDNVSDHVYHFLENTIFLKPSNTTQFEIERRSCGQSMSNLLFFVGVKISLQVVIIFLMYLVRNLQKKMEKMSKINPIVTLH